jgi:anti-sigma regulatory factor (Ser/Thr protein kinase)
MTRLHFQPIQGKAPSIIRAILQTEEVASLGDMRDDIRLMAEELVVNIVDYSGSDYLDVEIERSGELVTFRFRDGGVAFNPLEKEPPDITQPWEQRRIGGLGIFMVMKRMDKVEYDYTNGENVLTISKDNKNLR